MYYKNKEYKEGQEIKNLIIPAYISKTGKELPPNYIPEQFSNYQQEYTYIPLMAPDEIFVFINSEEIVPGRYMVSNYGRIFSLLNNVFMQQQSTDKGYLRVGLSCLDGKKHIYFVHRLVMMTFLPIENPEQYQVNHINGCTWCNWLCNLEWATPLENVHHSYEELRPEVEAICISKEKAYEVGNLIKDTTLSLKEIAEKTGVSYVNVRNISCGSSHKDVYEELELDQVTRLLPEDTLHDIFRLYSQGYQAYQIADELNLNRKTVTNIVYGGKKHLDIRNQYDLSNAYVPTKITDEDVHNIMILFSNGYTPTMISHHLDINRKTIVNITSGRAHRDIYEQYDLSNAPGRSITDDIVRDIRRMYEQEGMTLTEIKYSTGYNISTISDIVKYRTHKNVV
jgi:DNA-binding CsgD family transcriptional regulator